MFLAFPEAVEMLAALEVVEIPGSLGGVEIPGAFGGVEIPDALGGVAIPEALEVVETASRGTSRTPVAAAGLFFGAISTVFSSSEWSLTAVNDM